LLALAPVLAAGCVHDDSAVLEAARLVVSPCRGDEPRTFEPYRFEAGFLRWAAAKDMGRIEMRDGFYAGTRSDTVVLEFPDTGEVRSRLATDPAAPLPLDGNLVRIGVVLNETCPDATQSLRAGPGTLTLSTFDTDVDGEIAGVATFDLVDARPGADATVVAKDASLRFSMTVRDYPPYQEFANP
jgi:hypothetical protein